MIRKFYIAHLFLTDMFILCPATSSNNVDQTVPSQSWSQNLFSKHKASLTVSSIIVHEKRQSSTNKSTKKPRRIC